jgi:hypothetical protein
MRRVAMWSGPRNVSTAMMYSWRQRSDTLVFDEPLYAHYLRETGRQHPGRSAVLAAQDADGAAVVRDVLLAQGPRPVRFYKCMAHHLVALDPAFLAHLDHLLLVRAPAGMLKSLREVLPDADLFDTGLPQQLDLARHLLAAGRRPVLLETAELLADPESALRRVCHALSLPWDPAMLTWPPGPKPEDGVWAPIWYASVHRSSGFHPPRNATVEGVGEDDPLLSSCEALYAELIGMG